MDMEKLKEIRAEIAAISKAATRLKELSEEIQAIDRNVSRIQASVKMLEINISDLLTLTDTYR